jgi:hypothetical protein
VQVVALMSQLTQGELQEAQILFTESLNVLSGHVSPQTLFIKNLPEMQLVQVVSLTTQFMQGELQVAHILFAVSL